MRNAIPRCVAALAVCLLFTPTLLLAGCGAKKPMEPAATKDAMPGSAPPGGAVPAKPGANMGSKMVPGAGPVGGGNMGAEVGGGKAGAGKGGAAKGAETN